MRFISEKVHTIIGLIVGVILVFAPGIFNFADNQAASMVALWVGIYIILSELITKSPYSPAKLISMKIHTYIDVAVGLFLLFSPWIFNFMTNSDVAQWLPHVVVGLLVVGYALLTSPEDDTIGALS